MRDQAFTLTLILLLAANLGLLAVTGRNAENSPSLGQDSSLSQLSPTARKPNPGDEKRSLRSGKYRLQFVQTQSGEYGILIADDTGESLYRQSEPLNLQIRSRKNSLASHTSGYKSVDARDSSIRCCGTVSTRHGSVFEIVDTYRAHFDDGGFLLSRKIEVLQSGASDLGFHSIFGMHSHRLEMKEGCSFFAPGVWYDKNDRVRPGAIGDDKDLEYYYFRTTRLGLPMIMMYNPGLSSYLSLGHYRPQIGSGVDESSSDWLVDASIQYASLGIHKKPYPQLDFTYPGSEGEINYVKRSVPWIRRSHPVRRDVSHEYRVLIKVGSSKDYRSAMRESWRYFYDAFSPQIVPCDVDRVYKAGVELLAAVTREYFPGTLGTPFTLWIPDGRPKGISHQIGFTGQQGPVGYQLLKYGIENSNQPFADKGEGVIDFWADQAFTETDFPKMWYVGGNSENPNPHFRNTPTFLRSAADGMEGLIDSWVLINKHGSSKPNWLAASRKFGDWLVETQNPDGSFFRKFNWDGSIANDLKFNTSNPIRFLVKLHYATGDEEYLLTARKAGEWCYENIYLPNHYIAGVNNSSSIDKEAGIMALYAFIALFDATGEEKWLEAAKAAADFSETWTYCWNIPVKESDDPCNVYNKVGASGQSFISTGHSGVDNFMSFADFYYYRLYLFTGDNHYLDFARFLQNNTKQTTDWQGLFGYKYPGFVQEAHNVSSFTLKSVGTWLPWATIAELDPLSKFKDMFGSMDIDRIQELPLETRREMNRAAFE